MKIGLGFLFGSKDDGARKALVSARTGLAAIDKAASVATKSSDRLKMAIGSFQIHGLNEIADKLSDISSGNVNQLTSSLQSQSIAFDKSFAANAARAGIFGAEMKALEKQVFGVAYGLNADADAAGEAVIAFKKLGLSEKDLGLDNMSDLIKFANVAGLDMNALAQDAANLKKSYSFGDQTGAFVDDLLKQSTSLGLGTQGLASMTEMLNNMDDAFAQTLAAEGPDAVRATTASILKMAGAMKSALGTDPQTAMTKSIELFKKLQEQANVLPKMMAGMEDDFDPMIEKLAVELPGGFSQAFSLMQTDPAQFMSVMEKTVGNFRGLVAKGVPGAASDLQRLLGVLAELGPEFSFLADSGGAFGRALATGATQAGVGMKQLANDSYKTGLTLDDQIERAREGFKTRLFGLTQKETVAFVRGQESMYKRLGNAFQVAVEGGASFSTEQQAQFSFIERAALSLNKNGLGPVVDKLLYLHRVGPMALGPMFELLQEIAPIGLAMGALGLRFEHFGKALGFVMGPLKWVAGLIGTVLSPLIAFLGPEVMIVVGAVAALAGAVYLFSKALDGTLGPTMKEWSTWVQGGLLQGLSVGTEWLTSLTDQMSAMDPAGLVQTASDWFSSVVDQVLASLSGNMGAESLGPLSDAGVQFVKAFGRAVVASSTLLYGIGLEVASRLTDGFTLSLGDLFGRNVDATRSVHDGLRAAIAGVDWESVFSTLAAQGVRIRGIVVDRIVEFMGMAAKKIASVDWSNLGESLAHGMFSSLIVAMGESGSTSKEVGKVFARAMRAALGQVFTISFWEDALSLLWATLKFGFGMRRAAVDFGLGLAIGVAKAFAGGIMEYGPRLILDAVNSWKQVFSGLWAFIYDGAFGLFGNSIHALVESDLAQIFGVVETVKGWFTSLFDFSTAIVTGIGSTITTVFTAVYEGVSGLLSRMTELFYNAWDTIKASLSGMTGMLGPVLTAIVSRASPSIEGDSSKAGEVASTESSTRAKLLEQADNRALMVLMSREFDLTRQVLQQIVDRMVVTNLPVVAAPGGTSQGRTQTGVTRDG
jgi:hypothetical protein